jgi:hypothetical protein
MNLDKSGKRLEGRRTLGITSWLMKYQMAIKNPEIARNPLSNEFVSFLGTPSKKGKTGKTEGEIEGFPVIFHHLIL